ncbi:MULTISPECIES: phosphotransferase family protein [unclassified Gordonia (in: high G+C Gram-positive bacteria)]|uniref:phosphotransferase family protein n=1 Tax=unclassified Gordonia (in: high G+C Gram-positive bacteria) TaxID=2657482 RepID=UPI001F103FB3|nr:phosphotransferase family protein [Gordonia sp. ABSL49_1]MCH5642139.1 phosphotransferase family protein [Gordonia sp. ABSL49_1]
MPTTPTSEAIAGVDLAALSDWMEREGLPDGAITDPAPIGGGTQNIMVRFSRGDTEFVLRRGPLHLRPGSNSAISREMRLLAALADTAVPHARFIAGSTDEEILGAVFYLMEPVDGFNAATHLPAAYAAAPAGRRVMGFALVDALAALAAVDHTDVGLDDFGRPDGFLERQVPRWLGEFDRYADTPGYPGPEFGDVGKLASWLDDNRPGASRPGILHGDYHIANVMYAMERPEVAAIVDWEMATIGDPLLDVGMLSAIWPEYDGESDLYESALGATGDLPSRASMLERYAAQSDRDLSAIDWYTVLACFKIGIILEGTYARSCAGAAGRDVGERLRRYANGLFDRAHRIVG